MLRTPVAFESYRRLSPPFQFSLSGATLVYLSQWAILSCLWRVCLGGEGWRSSEADRWAGTGPPHSPPLTRSAQTLSSQLSLACERRKAYILLCTYLCATWILLLMTNFLIINKKTEGKYKKCYRSKVLECLWFSLIDQTVLNGNKDEDWKRHCECTSVKNLYVKKYDK